MSSARMTFIPLDIGNLPVKRNWAAEAVCAQTDPEAFFPEKGGGNSYAIKTCRGCPVRLDCLNEALNTGDDEGVRGGYSGHARREMRKHKRREPFDAPRPRRGNRKERKERAA